MGRGWQSTSPVRHLPAFPQRDAIAAGHWCWRRGKGWSLRALWGGWLRWWCVAPHPHPLPTRGRGGARAGLSGFEGRAVFQVASGWCWSCRVCGWAATKVPEAGAGGGSRGALFAPCGEGGFAGGAWPPHPHPLPTRGRGGARAGLSGFEGMGCLSSCVGLVLVMSHLRLGCHGSAGHWCGRQVKGCFPRALWGGWFRW